MTSRIAGMHAAELAAARSALALALGMVACAPTLNWRELAVEGTPVRVMLPCKPSIFARSVAVAGQSVQWTLLSCRAQDATWALGYANVADPAALGSVLRSLAGAQEGTERLMSSVPGFGANPETGRWRWTRVAADGPPLRGETVVAVHARQVFRVTVTGQRLDPEAVDFFFSSFNVRP